MLLLIKGSKQSTTDNLYRNFKKNLSRDGEILMSQILHIIAYDASLG